MASAEAWTNARLVRATGMADATSIGAAVTFPLGHRWVGFTVTTGCSVALLLIPPFAVAGFLVAFRRVGLGRAVLSVATAVGLLAAVNQVRFGAVVAAMQAWGFEAGYQRSHVLIGSAITMLGLIAVAILFAVLVGRGGRTRRGSHAA
ncbi:hypothetical protein [Micromonospora sp. NPDC002575]|uniref:hypothetical protein n=1 Tax=Micromonospora sp. NPDC002575 TaxID=3364222 RepID=UPI0036952A54